MQFHKRLKKVLLVFEGIFLEFVMRVQNKHDVRFNAM